jgi:nicotinamidase-related amidase
VNHKDQARTIVEEWAAVNAPSPPELVPVKLDARTAALLILDIQRQNCSAERRPRCVASVPRIQSLLARARERRLLVVHTLTRNTSEADIRPEVAPLSGEPVVRSSVDKFYRTELEASLREAGIRAVILAGTSAHGAVLHTATGAAQRGFDVIVPVDGMSAGEPYAEQYTAWHLANSPGTRRRVTLTRIDLIEF